VEDPLNLAELILNDPAKYNRSALESIVESRETQRVNLKPKVPVIILYITAGLGADGEIRFYKDIYNRDQKVLDALDYTHNIVDMGQIQNVQLADYQIVLIVNDQNQQFYDYYAQIMINLLNMLKMGEY